MNKCYRWYTSGLLWLPCVIYSIIVHQDFGLLVGNMAICFLAGSLQLLNQRRKVKITIDEAVLNCIANILILLYTIIYVTLSIIYL